MPSSVTFWFVLSNSTHKGSAFGFRIFRAGPQFLELALERVGPVVGRDGRSGRGLPPRAHNRSRRSRIVPPYGKVPASPIAGVPENPCRLNICRGAPKSRVPPALWRRLRCTKGGPARHAGGLPRCSRWGGRLRVDRAVLSARLVERGWTSVRWLVDGANRTPNGDLLPATHVVFAGVFGEVARATAAMEPAGIEPVTPYLQSDTGDLLPWRALRSLTCSGMSGLRLSFVEFPGDDSDRARRFWSGLLGEALGPREASDGEGWQTRS